MTLLRRANENTQSDWIPVPEGLWRFSVGSPELKLSEKFGNYQVRFPLYLTASEQNKLIDEYGVVPVGSMLSFRMSYSCGLSLGYVQRDGQYKSTKMVDFLAACLGTEASKNFRAWIADGGGPTRPDDLDDQKAELDAIQDWLQWWVDLEVYGSVRHNTSDSGVVYANFSGPIPVGSLPGQKEIFYVALGRGKLLSMKTEIGPTREHHARASLTPE